MQTGERHAVTTSVCQVFQQLGEDLIPPDLLEAAAVHLADIRERNEVLTGALIEIVTALEAQGYPAIPFKGPLVAQIGYGDVGLRRFRDLDILMLSEHALAAEKIFNELGFEQMLIGREESMTPAQAAAYRRYSGQDLLHRATDNVAIEPHWSFAPSTIAFDLDYPAMWSRAVRVELFGREVSCLERTDLVIMLCLHGSKEKWVRLQWIGDLARTLAASPDLDWDELLRRAGAQGCRRMVLLGLALIAEVAGMELPASVAAEVARDGKVAELVAGIVPRLFDTSYEETSVYELNRFHWDMRERLRDRLAYVWRTLVTPRHTHYQIVKLPDALFVGYYPVKVVHDFLLLPLWRLLRPLVKRET